MMIIIVSNSTIDLKMSLYSVMYMYVIDNKLYSILFYSLHRSKNEMFVVKHYISCTDPFPCIPGLLHQINYLK